MKGIALHRNVFRALFLSTSIAILDQSTKLFVKGFSFPFLNLHHAGMELGSSIPLFRNILHITYIENPGMAFGLEIGSQLILALLSLLACIGVIYYLNKIREESFLILAPMAMILGGAVGNLIDRSLYGVFFGYAPLFYGRVVDFVDVRFLHLSRFGIFNVADAAVTTGILWLILFHRSLVTVPKPLADPETLQVVRKPEPRNPQVSADGTNAHNEMRDITQ